MSIKTVALGAIPMNESLSWQALTKNIQTGSAKVGVIGLGYVGLPLACEFARHGFHVTGIDLNESKVRGINSGKSYIGDVSTAEVSRLVKGGTLSASIDYAMLSGLDVVDICVPTPLRKTKDPDLSFILAALEQIQKYLRPSMLVILESTTYPGTTEELILPRLEETGLKVGKDFFLCFSPERIDPGNSNFNTRNIPKVIGGVTPACTAAGVLFYRQALENVVPVSSTSVAEMVKLLENTFRSINIGLANEMAILCDRMKINVWEVIDAAATKPFGFMPFYPGPGLGGHCIPVDPFYLSWKARMHGVEARFIELAGQINGSMPRFLVNKIQAALNAAGKSVKNSHIHLLGVAYKRDVSDIRESPALDVWALLEELEAIVSYSDPHVDSLQVGTIEHAAMSASDGCRAADCVALITDHSAFDYATIARESLLIVDARNAFRRHPSDKIVRL